MLVYQRVKLGKLNLTSIWMWSHLTHFEKHHEWRVDRHFSDREVHIVASWMSILLREHRSTVRPSSFWRQASPLLLVPSQFCLVNVQFWSLVGGFKHFLFFPSYWECHHPNWLYHIFFRGVGSTTKQWRLHAGYIITKPAVPSLAWWLFWG